ncbi:uncharacterized protein TNCV_2120121 [Trichonephila clavipes]|nr:uncharacterized protein TNCV_2120121 [Trichonephila clavipes]
MSSRRETTESERLLVVKWSKEGKSLREIASLIGVTHGCVQKILQKYKKTGSVANIPGEGRKEILCTTAKRKIIHPVKKDPRVSASKLALSLSSTIRKKISDETIRRTLHQYGFRGRTLIRKPLIKKQLHTPAQSPDLNAIENLWSQLEKAVHEHEITSKEVFKKVLREEWAKLSVETAKALLESMPRRLQAVIQAKGYATKY